MTTCPNTTIEELLQCYKNNSLADPWPHSEAYTIFMHCLSVVSISLFLFAAYCIHYKTISEAKFFARLQFVHLLWTTFTDFIVTSLCTPIIFVPYMAGYLNGILSSFFGVNPFFQTCLTLYALICSASSILHLLWFKTYIVLPIRHWLRKEWFFTRGLFVMYLLWAIFSVWCFFSLSEGMEEQWIGSLQRMTGTPSQLYNGHLDTVFLVARKEQSASFKFINIAIILYILLCLLAFSWSMLIINRLPTNSEKTKKMQKKAMWALGIQVGVFLLLFTLPMSIFYFAGRMTENPLPVGISYANFVILFLASIGDTSTMIALNEGYRTAFLEKTRLNRFFKKKERLVVPISHASSIPSDQP